MTKEQDDKIIAQAQDILERRMAIEKDIKVNLQHIAMYAAHYQGAIMAVRKVADSLLSGNKPKKDDWLYLKAEWDLITSDKRNMQLWLDGTEIRYRNHIRNKKGKLESVECYFVERKKYNSRNKIITTMEEFRKSLYAACRQMNLEIVPNDIGARVMAFAGLAGADERVCYSPRLKCELEHLQELYHIQGGSVPDQDFVERIQIYTNELQEYTDKHNGEWPEWLNSLIYNRYGFKPYKL